MAGRPPPVNRAAAYRVQSRIAFRGAGRVRDGWRFSTWTIPYPRIRSEADKANYELFRIGNRVYYLSMTEPVSDEDRAKLDKIAYIRFASVYRSFETPDDFREALQELKAGKKKRK